VFVFGHKTGCFHKNARAMQLKQHSGKVDERPRNENRYVVVLPPYYTLNFNFNRNLLYAAVNLGLSNVKFNNK